MAKHCSILASFICLFIKSKNILLFSEDKVLSISSKYNIYVTYQDRFRIYLGDNSETEMKLTFAKLMINEFKPEQSGTVDAHDITVGSVILDN